MKKLLLLALLLTPAAWGQSASRFDSQALTIGPGFSGGFPQVLAVPGATIAICSYPANAVPCTNYATTYTDQTLGTACPSSAQVVLANSSTCVSAADSQGNFGFWYATSVGATGLAYTITASNGQSYGPYWLLLGGDSGLSCLLTGCTLTGPFSAPSVNSTDGYEVDGSYGTSGNCMVSTGSASGWTTCPGVSTLSTGNLSPLFTASVANPTTTPALSFTLSNAGANTVFGNMTGSTGAPGYSTIAASNLSNGTTGTGEVVLAENPTLAGATIPSGAVLTLNGYHNFTLESSPTSSQDSLVITDSTSGNQVFTLENGSNAGAPGAGLVSDGCYAWSSASTGHNVFDSFVCRPSTNTYDFGSSQNGTDGTLNAGTINGATVNATTGYQVNGSYGDNGYVLTSTGTGSAYQALGSAASTYAGTGTATAGCSGCGTGYSLGCIAEAVCDSFSGTFLLTTGTSAATATILVTLPNTRSHNPNCVTNWFLDLSPYGAVSYYPFSISTSGFEITSAAPSRTTLITQ